MLQANRRGGRRKGGAGSRGKFDKIVYTCR